MLWELQRKRFEENRGNRKLCHLNPFEFLTIRAKLAIQALAPWDLRRRSVTLPETLQARSFQLRFLGQHRVSH